MLKLFHVRTDPVTNSGPSLLETPFETAEQTPPCPEQNTKPRSMTSMTWVVSKETNGLKSSINHNFTKISPKPSLYGNWFGPHVNNSETIFSCNKLHDSDKMSHHTKSFASVVGSKPWCHSCHDCNAGTQSCIRNLWITETN